MIINELEESDSEFWTELEKIPMIHAYPSVCMTNSADNTGNKFLSCSQNSPTKGLGLANLVWSREYFEDKMNRIRESTGPEIQRSTIKAENKVKRHYSEKLQVLRVKYITDFKELMLKFTDLRDILTNKDEYIHNLIQILSDSQLLTTETAIKLLKTKKPANNSQQDAEKTVLIEEIYNLREQVTSLKELCNIYQKDTDTAKFTLEKMVKDYENFKLDSEKTVNNLMENLTCKEKVIERLNSSKLAEIEKLKEGFKKESLIMEEIQNRQSNYIQQLQDELKNAKNVLQNKYLRNMYYKTLKEYKDEGDKCSRAPLTAPSSVHKRAQSAVKGKNRNSSGIFDSFNTEKPLIQKRKVQRGKPIFTGILQGSIFNTWSEGL